MDDALIAACAALGVSVGRLVIYLRRTHKEAVGHDSFLALGLIGLTYGLTAPGRAAVTVELSQIDAPELCQPGGAEARRALAVAKIPAMLEEVERCGGFRYAWEFRTYSNGQIGLVGYISGGCTRSEP